MKNSLGWEEVRGLAAQLGQIIVDSSCQVNLIVAVARGGFVPARLLSDTIGVKRLSSIGITYTDAERSQREVYSFPGPINAEHRILLVEDVLESGQSLVEATDLLRASGATVWTAAFYYRSDSVVKPDFSLGIQDEPVAFPWEVS